jgi:hypothetical protein
MLNNETAPKKFRDMLPAAIRSRYISLAEKVATPESQRETGKSILT